VVDAERALFNGDFGSATLAGAIIAAVAVAALGLIVGTRAMQRST
jgi:ABC-2 type transport system permease protein